MKNFSLLPRATASWPASILIFLSAVALPLLAHADLHYLPEGKPDTTILLAPPPVLNSAEQIADLNEVRTVFHAASSNDMAAVYSEKKISVFNFTPEVGAFFQPNNLPQTTAFFEKVQLDAEVVTDLGKSHFKRPRPYTTDPTLANGKLEKSFGYPSGHSTESMVLALVLADLFPEKRKDIIAHAQTMGWHRVQIARHYPTDIHAGRVLAQAIARQMSTNNDFKKDFDAVKSEISAAAK